MCFLRSRGQVSALLDWTNVCIAEPTFDVTCTMQILSQWPLDVPAAVRPVVEVLGRRAARRFVAFYRGRSPIDIDRIPWYEVLHSVRRLARVADARLATASEHRWNDPWATVADANIALVERLTGISLTVPRAPAR